MNFVVILATMAAFWHRGSTESTNRQGKFLGLSSEEMFGDILDEASDPLPMPSNSLSVRTRILQKLRQENNSKKPTILPPIALPEKLIQKLTSTIAPPTEVRPQLSYVKVKKNATKPEPLVLYDTSTSKFEILPPGFASQPQPTPITESMFVFGGQFGQKSPANVTDQKIFWSSVGDFIEGVPFLPVEVNVPDLIQAMAAFISQRLPFANRFGNPNQPRPNIKVPVPPTQLEAIYPDLPVETNLLEYRHMTKPKKNKRKKNTKKKQSKRSTTENYILRGSYKRTTEKPKKKYASKTWFQRATTEAPAAKTTQSPKFFNRKTTSNDQVKYKNMPFTRQHTRYADKELFNFKHSDISNSPIMILNMPNRPVVMYKVKNEQKSEIPLIEKDDHKNMYL